MEKYIKRHIEKTIITDSYKKIVIINRKKYNKGQTCEKAIIKAGYENTVIKLRHEKAVIKAGYEKL